MPYLIIPPGGPAGPFYGLVKAPQGWVIAMQITNEEWAKRIKAGLELLDKKDEEDQKEYDLLSSSK
jgi:hypothetical protein